MRQTKVELLLASSVVMKLLKGIAASDLTKQLENVSSFENLTYEMEGIPSAAQWIQCLPLF